MRYGLWFLPLSIILLLFSCGGDNSSSNDPESILEQPVWLWAFDDDSSTVTVYNGESGDSAAHFAAEAFGKMHLMVAGPTEEPTLWMGKSGNIYAFTTGFYNHGDHADMETPESYASLTLGTSTVHLGQSPSGDTVAFADDNAQSIYIVDVATKTLLQTITHGSGHSAALIAEGYAVTTAATASGDDWAKIVDIATDSVLDSLTIGTGAHGDAYYSDGKKAFIACAGAFYVIDLASRAVVDSIPYTETGRTNFVYHGRDNVYAVGLHKPASDSTSDMFLLLDMENDSLDYVSIEGAALNWHIGQGQFALSGSGDVALFSDVLQQKIYQVVLATQSVTTLTAPGIGCAIATNYDGSKVWALSNGVVSQIDVATDSVEGTLDVPTGTDWIYASSIGVDVEEE
ncbi:MAG TPA: hypothetical protein VLM37_04535 [Fibrobacteraceae bacterium]|nr:hypothetical protein [Fibrobacteraceae bacterium]